MRSLNEIIFQILTKNNLTFSVAESVTGGMLSSAIVGTEGASKVYKGGIVSYTNEIKERLLGVRSFTLEKYGAISAQTAKEMASGVAKLFATPISIGTTGIASGSVENKPCGLVYFCILIVDRFYEYELHLSAADRNDLRIEATSKIVNEFARLLIKFDK